jgi:hypothetical protein
MTHDPLFVSLLRGAFVAAAVRFSAASLALALPTLPTMTPALASDRGFAPSAKEFTSQSLEITFGSIAAISGRPQLMLNLRNKTDRALWLRVAFQPPAPNLSCTQIQHAEPKQQVDFTCAQDSIISDTDYPIAITVFADSAESDTVENNSTHMRFGKKDVKAFQRLTEAGLLPKTYEDVVLKEKLGMGAALFGSMGNGGTLTVKTDGLEWTTKKRTVTVALDQLRDVAVRQLGHRPSDAWVVVDYDDGGNSKILAFQGSAFRGAGPEMIDQLHASIAELLGRRKAKE